LDLYALISRGDKSADVRLLDGDIVVIPPALGYVALIGEVETPKIFELRDKAESLGEVIELAGGLPIMANPRKAIIEQLDPALVKPRSVVEVNLDVDGRSRRLQFGDIVSILPIRGEFSNAVVLRGALDNPVRMRFQEGMRITDLIPNKAFLVSRSVASRQYDQAITNPAVVGGVGNKFDVINCDYAAVERLDYGRQTTSLLPFNLGRAIESPVSADNVLLQPGDTIHVFTASDAKLPIAKTPVYVRIEGEVARPGVYQARPGESLATMVERAGGLTENAYLFASEFTRESVKLAQQANLDRLIKKMEQQYTSEHSRSAQNLINSDAAAAHVKLAAEEAAKAKAIQQLRLLKPSGRVSLPISPENPSLAQLPGLTLEAGDRYYVPPRSDFVHVVGHVQIESAMLWQHGSAISDYMNEAGLLPDADSRNVLVIRADGRIASNYGRWFSGVKGLSAFPGDTIVIPELIDKESTWTMLIRNFKDMSQILSGFGITAAAIHTLSKQ
jgi:protein involved in polysaccharide export with SLBB domain